MKIGNFDTGSLFGGFSIGGFASTLFWGMIVIVAIGLIGWYFYSRTKSKVSYTNPITLTQFYENGTQKTSYGLMGGKFINKANVNDFRIKLPGLFSFKKKELGYMPDFSKSDTDGALHFLTTGDGNFWQQMGNKIVTSQKIVGQDKEGKDVIIDEVSLIMTPIPADIKTYTINSMKSWSEMLNKNKITVFGIGLGMFIIMVIAHLISLYIQTKIKCGIA
jgi:hypothetical protein